MIIKTDPDFIEPYNKDASNYRGNAGIVYIPENTDELSEIVAQCYMNDTQVTVSGAGTGLCGGRTAPEGAVISMEHFNRILDIDYNCKSATLETGVLLSALESELNRAGFFYPPNPTEKDSSIGGNIANNSSGARTFKYGPTRNYVDELEIVLANGELLSLKRGETLADGNNLTVETLAGNTYSIFIPEIFIPDTKHVAGYHLKPGMDAVDLFIGSEGTLGIITKAKLRFLEQPEKILGLLIFFDREDRLFAFVDEIRKKSRESFGDSSKQHVISARLIEFFDSESLKLLSGKYPQIPGSTGGAVWVEQEHSTDDEEVTMETWLATINEYTNLADYTWAATNSHEHEQIRDFRHSLPSMVVDIISRNNSAKFGTDTAVPDMYNYLYYQLIKKHLLDIGLPYIIYGHIGNSHYHANLFISTIEETVLANNFYASVIDDSLKLGGTISAEHGIGKIKKEYMKKMYGENVINMMKGLKQVFDPKMLLGKGNIFD